MRARSPFVSSEKTALHQKQAIPQKSPNHLSMLAPSFDAAHTGAEEPVRTPVKMLPPKQPPPLKHKTAFATQNSTERVDSNVTLYSSTHNQSLGQIVGLKRYDRDHVFMITARGKFLVRLSDGMVKRGRLQMMPISGSYVTWYARLTRGRSLFARHLNKMRAQVPAYSA